MMLLLTAATMLRFKEMHSLPLFSLFCVEPSVRLVVYDANTTRRTPIAPTPAAAVSLSRTIPPRFSILKSRPFEAGFLFFRTSLDDLLPARRQKLVRPGNKKGRLKRP